MATVAAPKSTSARLVGLMIGAGSVLLLVLAVGMNDGWAERHLLPTWAYSWQTELKILFWLRIAVVTLALAVLLLLRPWACRAIAAGRGRQVFTASLSGVLAILLAFVTVESILHIRSWRSKWERWDQEEPLRLRDAEYGWSFVPHHAGAVALHGRTVRYDTGPFGYRVASAGVAPAFERPTILVAGESIMLGYGLEWSETVGAQLERTCGVQTANMAVNAHSIDQTLMRLRRELPRFARPRAVVIPFVPSLLDRNLDADRPHLDAQLRWHRASPPSFRLVALLRRAVRYRSEEAIAQGVAMTQAALRKMIAMAQARGARALVVVPQFLPESPQEAKVRRTVLDEGRIPYLLVPIRSELRFPVDRHPAPRGARVIALAIDAALRSRAEPAPLSLGEPGDKGSRGCFPHQRWSVERPTLAHSGHASRSPPDRTAPLLPSRRLTVAGG